MLSEREITSTLNMLRNEHLDVRTVTLGVSLFDCVSHDLDLFTANVRAKLRRYASQLVAVCDGVGRQVRHFRGQQAHQRKPHRRGGRALGPDGMVRVCRALTRPPAKPAWTFWAAFPPWWKKAFANGDRALIEALPEALPKQNVSALPSTWLRPAAASTWTPWLSWSRRIRNVAAATADRGGIGCHAKLVVCQHPQDVPFMARAYLGVRANRQWSST